MLRRCSEVYPGLADAVSESCPDPAELRVTSQETFEIAGNWKNVADNLLECYHCHPAHRAFVRLRSLGYHQGRMICIPDRPKISEHAVHHFQSMVRAALSDSTS